jgi:small subunit ribosomal protein S2
MLNSLKNDLSNRRTAKEEVLLLPREVLLAAGIQVGSRIKTKAMKPYIFKIRPDGIPILDIEKFDERIRIAAKFIAQFEPARVIVVSNKLYGKSPVRKFCEVTGATAITGRFLPGSFSNPEYAGKLNPQLTIVTDPIADQQVIVEASATGIPVIAIVDADNTLENIDLAIPANNKGRKALATIFWLLARQVLRERGEIPPDGDLAIPIEEFETKVEEE